MTDEITDDQIAAVYTAAGRDRTLQDRVMLCLLDLARAFGGMACVRPTTFGAALCAQRTNAGLDYEDDALVAAAMAALQRWHASIPHTDDTAAEVRAGLFGAGPTRPEAARIRALFDDEASSADIVEVCSIALGYRLSHPAAQAFAILTALGLADEVHAEREQQRAVAADGLLAPLRRGLGRRRGGAIELLLQA